jgi:hypothetical protein
MDEDTTDEATLSHAECEVLHDRPPLVKAIEWVGTHPFATGVLAILGILGFILSIYSFAQGQVQAEADQKVQEALTDQVGTVQQDLQKVPGVVPEAADFDPVIASVNPIDDADNITFSNDFLTKITPEMTARDRYDLLRWLQTNDGQSFSEIFVASFAVKSVAQRDFVQIAPYLIVQVGSVSEIPQNMTLLDLGERGGAASIRDFSSAILPKAGYYYAPLVNGDNMEIRSDVDYFTLMPGEPEEFVLWLNSVSGYIYNMRIGVQYRYKDRHGVHWVTNFFRNGAPNHLIRAYGHNGDAEYKLYREASPEAVRAMSQRNDDFESLVGKGRVFNPRQVY